MNEQPSPSNVTPPAWQMMQIIWGLMPSRVVSVAAQFGIADLLAGGPKTVEELATEAGVYAGSLQRLLSALASLQILVEDEAGKYRSTPLGETLRTDHPQSVRALAMLWGRSMFLTPWQHLDRAITTGTPTFDSLYGHSFFHYLEQHPEDASIFNAAMSGTTAADASAVLAAYDFSRFKQVMDVGGGRGAFAILSATPHLKGFLYDLESVVTGVQEEWDAEVAKRCEVRSGSFFETAPEGADAYLLKRIIHDWDDEAALKILRNCRRAIPSDGTLLLVERVLKPRDELDFGKFLDLHMFVVLGGRERSEAEFTRLLRESSFRVTRVISTTGPHSIVESTPL
jgi:L-alanine-DL-glutamate epimerase-like enolase superfamily enzyme